MMTSSNGNLYRVTGSGSELYRTMDICLFSSNPLPEPMSTYYELNRMELKTFTEISIKTQKVVSYVSNEVWEVVVTSYSWLGNCPPQPFSLAKFYPRHTLMYFHTLRGHMGFDLHDDMIITIDLSRPCDESGNSTIFASDNGQSPVRR